MNAIRPKNYFKIRDQKAQQLLRNIKKHLPELKKIQEGLNNMFGLEDIVYRFYHQSYKVFHAQGEIQRLTDIFKLIAPKNCNLNEWFMKIIADADIGTFKDKYNNNWLKYTRPQIEALFHAKYFLDMMIKYGQKLKKAPDLLPSGWASVLYLYDLR